MVVRSLFEKEGLVCLAREGEDSNNVFIMPGHLLSASVPLHFSLVYLVDYSR